LIRVGTRGSALALAQAQWVADRLGSAYERVRVTTVGDRGAGIGDKSRWTSELERALLEGEIDIAVHSAKDVPAEIGQGLELVAFPVRADPRDVICGSDSLAALSPGARVGTSSVRRVAQIRALRDDLELVSLRGNVDTRLRKLAEGECDAIVIAMAGLERLGRVDAAGGVLDELVPAPGQGALALEARDGWELPGSAASLNDPDTSACVRAERDLVRKLEASCNTPVGACGRVVTGDLVELRAWAGLPDGSSWLSDCLTGPSAEVGVAVAGRLLAVGAGELLRRAALGAVT
jgi:hydroxymethylbilane synthase